MVAKLDAQHDGHVQVAIRDAPCAGHPWRYSKHQLAYHYTAEREIIRRLVAFSSSPKDAPEVIAAPQCGCWAHTCSWA